MVRLSDRDSRYIYRKTHEEMKNKILKLSSHYLRWVDVTLSINDLKCDIEEMELMGITHVYIQGEDVEVDCYKERLETDAEYAQRLSREACLKKFDEINELKELKRLKEKYDL